MNLAVPLIVAAVISATLVALVRRVALRLDQVVVSPAASGGAVTKAKFGGAAAAVATFGCALGVGAFESGWVIPLCSVVVFALGLVSDVIKLRPPTKAVGLVAVASAVLFFGLRLHWTDSITLDSLATILWIVAITSAFNLLDTMDGLCGGIALIAGAAFLVNAVPVASSGVPPAEVVSLVVMLGAIAGFLPYNVHPARVVMGDAGSLLIGFNIATMTLQFARGRGSDLLSIVAVPLLVLLIPLVDTAVPAIMGALPGRSTRRKTHQATHRLVAIGLSERRVVVLLWLAAGASGMLAIVVDRTQYGVLLAALFTIAIALFAIYLARVEVHEGLDERQLPQVVTPLPSELGYRRRLAEVLLDLLLISVACYGAYRLRFEDEFATHFDRFARSFPIVVGVQIVVLFAVGAYRGMWRYFSLSDSLAFVKGVSLGVLLSQAVLLYLYRFEGYSFSVLVIYGLLLFVLLVGSRASVRLLDDFVRRQRASARRLVIYGAGDRGALAVRHVLNDSHGAYRIEGFIDDDVRKRNARVHGYPVIGGYDHLVGLIVAGAVDAVAVAQENVDVQGLSALCARHQVTLHRLSLDWSEIRNGEALATGLSTGGTDSRVVPFTGVIRPIAGDQGVRVPSELPAAMAAPAVRPRAGETGAAPVRVAHVITRLILGGAQENTLYTVVGQHRDPRFEVTLVCGVDEAGEGNMFAQAVRGGVRIVVLPSLVREIRPLTDLKSLFDLYRLFRRESFDIVHTHSSKAGIVGRLAARAAGVPIIVHTIHGLAFHEFQSPWKNRLYIALERLCAPLSDRIISVSRLLAESVLARGIGRPDQHVTIFSGIELDRFLGVGERTTSEDAKRRLGIPPTSPVVGKIARLFPLKGHEQFLAAASLIAARMPDTYFLLVGDGPLREQLLEDARRRRLDHRLVLAGRVPPEAVPEFIQAMDVVVHTSLREGIARVLPQAGAVGKPVVTFDLDGAPEVIRDGVSGYLVPPLDVAAVADRVVELLENPRRRQELGDTGRAFAAEHFSVERMVDRISALYVDLLPRGTDGVSLLDSPRRG